ncbi:uncharacterized protein [Triticum aestivum]|uniref:uncharacterized protein n=1 Tax=Triticum aestivum TaxID=4565 RepID=UPI001D00CAE1|nr:uncharacterized protein LOC123120599 [Triticum aestivum]
MQCKLGHLVCSPCRDKLPGKKKKACSVCSKAVSRRCHAMERVVESIVVPCSNAAHGCTAMMASGEKAEREEAVGCLALALPLTGTLSLSILSLERSEKEERRETQDTMVPAHERLPHERRLPRARTRAPHKQQYAGWSFIHGRAHTTPRSPLLHARTLRTPWLTHPSRTNAINAAGLQQNAAVTPATIANYPRNSASRRPLPLQQPAVPCTVAPRFRAPTVVAPSRRDFCATTQLLRDLLVSATAVLFACTTSVRTAVESPRVAVATRSPRAATSMPDALAARATARHGRKPVALMLSVGCLALALPLTGILSLYSR